MRFSGPTLDAADPVALAEFYERPPGWSIVRRDGPSPGKMMDLLRLRVVPLAVIPIICTTGCSGSGESDFDTPTTQPPSVDGSTSAGALLVGTLGGTTTCLWMGDDTSTATPLVFLAGTRTKQISDIVVEVSLDEPIRWAARTGQSVAAGGGFDSLSPNCLRNGVAPFQATELTPCDESTLCDGVLEDSDITFGANDG